MSAEEISRINSDQRSFEPLEVSEGEQSVLQRRVRDLGG